MKIFKRYKVELDPNRKQETNFLRHAGAARWTFNWGLRRKIDSYAATGKSPSRFDLQSEIANLKKVALEDGGVPWMKEVSSRAPRGSLEDLEKAFKNFFRRCKSGEAKKGFPRFKSRKTTNPSFRLEGDGLKISRCGTHTHLPNIGPVRIKGGPHPLPKKILSATVKQEADRWFCSFLLEEEVPDPVQPPGEVLGVDLGIKTLATLSDGTTFQNPKALAKHERKLKHLQRSLSRKVKGSANREKAKRKLRREHYKVKCVRRDAQHKATTAITKRAFVLVLEDLNVKGMVKNHCLAKAVSDAGMGEVRRQLEYKAKWRGIPVIFADRWYPSSKTCSSCGVVKAELGLGERMFACEACGLVLDRDHNAAINLKHLAPGFGATACGGDVRPGRKAQAAPLKQEPSSSLSRG